MGAAEWGLDRIRDLLTALETPQEAFGSIHIAGTNGKGSTAAFAATILREHGYTVGLYTSPHLYDITERFRVAGRSIDRSLLAEVASEIDKLPEASAATYFEVATALAFEAFRRVGVDWAVIEVGLGGRFDATNILHPRVTTVTTIGLDHADVLGATLEAVATEKAGIFEPDAPAVLGEMPEVALGVLQGKAAEGGGRVLRLGVDGWVTDVTTTRAGTGFRYASQRWPDGVRLRTPMLGVHQARNAGLAILTIETLGIPLEEQAVIDAIGQTRVSGRFEIRRQEEAMWVLDIAHNREGLEALLSTFVAIEMPRPWVAVVSILADKPWSGMLGMLRLDMDAIIVTQTASAPAARRWNLTEVVKEAEGEMVDLRLERDIEAAVDLAARMGTGGTILVTGSTHTVSDAGRLLERL